jgi:ATP-binding cassette subfamily B protein
VFFSGLNAEAYDRTYRDRELLVRISRYFRPYGRWLLWSVVGIVGMSVAQATVPILVSQGVDSIAIQTTGESFAGMAIALFFLGIVVWLFNWLRRRLTARAVGNAMLDLRADAFQASVSQDMAFYDEFSTGRVVSRITSDTQEFAQVIVLVTDLASQFVQVLILVVVLAVLDLRLTFWLLAILPVFFFVAYGFRKIARVVTRRGMRAMANVNAVIKEAVTGIAIAKNFRQETFIHKEFDEINLQSYRVNVRRGFVLSSVFPTLNALGGAGTAALTYLGGMSAAESAVTVGAWYLFLRGLERFWFPVLNLSAFWSQVQGGLSAAERVFALIDAESSVQQRGEAVPPKLAGRIDFERIEFHYKAGEPVLEEFSLTIPAGQNLALVGHTGAGKSSIVKLIARFYEFQEGRILVDDHDLRELDLQGYRSQLGIVPQVPFLFAGTVLDNIRYARPNAAEDNIRSLANQVGEGEWLDSLPEGLHSQVGERGKRLSMGQRQMVALMRVLVQKPSIFLLDEATANIDPFTESQIQHALTLILEQSTSIMIAHRLSTVKAADRILVMQSGKMIEEGNHQELMASGGHYAELYQTYFRHQSLAYVEGARRTALKEELGEPKLKTAR